MITRAWKCGETTKSLQYGSQSIYIYILFDYQSISTYLMVPCYGFLFFRFFLIENGVERDAKRNENSENEKKRAELNRTRCS